MFIDNEENYRTDVNDMANIGLRKNQINKNPTYLKIFKKRPEYIVKAKHKKDESFYSRGKKDNNFKSVNLKDYPIFKYSTI